MSSTIKEAIAALAEAVPNVMSRYEQVKDNLPELLTFYRQLRGVNSQIDQLTKVLSQIEQELSYKLIPEQMETLKVDSLKTGGYTYSLNVRTNANIPTINRENGMKWLRDNGFSALITENVNAKTLSSAINNYIQEHGLVPPEDAITIFQQKYISVRKS